MVILREIASKLQVHLAAINRDIQFLRQQAKENLQHHIHEVVPEEYQKCMVGIKRNLKQTLESKDCCRSQNQVASQSYC
jgi:hypothetical protein